MRRLLATHGLAISTFVPAGSLPGVRRRLPAALASLSETKYSGPLFVVDDGSTDEDHLDYLSEIARIAHVVRRPVRGGISRAKNTCLRLLATAGVSIGFLADDDILFLPGWSDAYLAAHRATGIHHFSWAWDENPTGPMKKVRREIQGSPVESTNLLNGVFLSFTPSVLKAVGGFKVLPAAWGHEHTHWTRRVVLAGLAPFFADIVDSNRYIGLNEYAADSAIPQSVRAELAGQNASAADDLLPVFQPVLE